MNKTLLPKLRFPEFQDLGEWEKKPLAIVANVIAGQSPDGANYNDKGIGTPFYQGKTDFGDIYIDKPTKWTTQVTKIAENGDILMSVRAPVGALNICVDQICIGRGLAAIKAKQNKWYLYYFLNSIQRYIVGNGGAIFDAINKDQIEAITTFLPDLPEQQKIADCLTALDDLIAAQSQKVAALQAYKKGLMQSLFPAEGESVPRLRFPEFQSAGEWEEKTLESVCDMQAGQFVSASDISEQYKNGLYPCYGGNGLRGYVSTFTHSGEYSLIGRQGALCGNVNFGVGKFHATEHAVVATEKNDIDAKWLFYTLGFLNLNQYATGQAQPGLSVTVLEKVDIAVPANIKEQQRIAELLTALDEQISAQGEALAALKVHKKGLMQGLFPSGAGRGRTAGGDGAG